MFGREVHEREEVVLGVDEHARGLRVGAFKHSDDLGELDEWEAAERRYFSEASMLELPTADAAPGMPPWLGPGAV